jgi:hypothetical protein
MLPTSIARKRFTQMRQYTRRRSKLVPSYTALMILELANKMHCLDCGCKMVWTRNESATCYCSLQHYNDGSLGFVCGSCNSKHAAMGDLYRALGPTMRICNMCKSIKHEREYYRHGGGRRASRCKQCDNAYRAAKRLRAKGISQ